MRFNYTIAFLTGKIKELYDVGGELPPEVFENSKLNKKIIEMEMAIRILKGHVFKLKEE